MSYRRQSALAATAVGAVAAAVALASPQPAQAGALTWKGAETFSPVSLLPAHPQVEGGRCYTAGAPVGQVLLARFAGSGIDNAGGHFAVTVVGCLDTTAKRLFGMHAVDRYSPEDTLEIEPGPVDLSVDDVTCVATNRTPAKFTVGKGTGRYSGAEGSGHYDVAFVYPPVPGQPRAATCDVPAVPVHVWFSGQLRLPGG